MIVRMWREKTVYIIETCKLSIMESNTEFPKKLEIELLYDVVIL